MGKQARPKSKKIKLYDLRKEDYPNKRGNSFRSLQVFECWVCGALTNLVIMGGYPGYGVRTICPHSAKHWHHELEDKIRWLRHPHPKSYLAALRKEIEQMKKLHGHQISNDLAGDPNMKLKRPITNTRSF